MFTKFTDFILRRSLFVIVVIALISAVALFSVFSITFNNSIDVFFDKGSESYSNFEEWKEQFGSDQVVIVAFSDRDIFSEENIRLIDFLTNRFELLTYVDNVHSLTSVNDIIGDEDNFIVETFIDEIPSRASELRQLRERALKNPLYRDNIISRDGRTTALIVELEKQEGSEDIYKRETIEAIQRILEEQFPAHKAYYVSGLTAIEYYYARYMHDDFKAFLPFIFVIIAVILLLAFRSISAALLLLLSVLISLL